MKKLSKKEIKDLIIESYRYGNIKEEEQKKMINLLHDLQNHFIEVLEYQQLKAGRTVYGGWPYALHVNVYDLKASNLKYKGGGVVTGDYASHKGIEHAAMDCIAQYYNISSNIYLYDYNLFKSCNITIKVYNSGYNGRHDKEAFKWSDKQ